MLIKGSETDDFIKDVLGTEFKVRVVHSNIHGAFMTLNGTMYISAKTIQICENNLDGLALIISHELSHYLLDHLPRKILKIYMRKIHDSFKIKRVDRKFQILDEQANPKDDLDYIKKYICLYPQSKLFSKYFEKRTDTLAQEICIKAGFDVRTGLDVFKTLEKDTPIVLEPNKIKVDPLYSYSRYDVNREILRS